MISKTREIPLVRYAIFSSFLVPCPFVPLASSSPQPITLYYYGRYIQELRSQSLLKILSCAATVSIVVPAAVFHLLLFCNRGFFYLFLIFVCFSCFLDIPFKSSWSFDISCSWFIAPFSFLDSVFVLVLRLVVEPVQRTRLLLMTFYLN